MRPRLSHKYIPLFSTVVVWVLLYVTASVMYRGFFSLQVFVNFFSDNSFLGIIAVGMTFVILSGGIDLSVGSMLALCSIVMAVLMQRGVPPAVAIAIVLALGTTLGASMGCLVRYFGLPPFIVTLAGMFFARGLGFIIHIESLAIDNAFYRAVTSRALEIGPARIPVTAFIFLAVVLVGVYVSAYTKFGRNVYAVGGNEEAAML
ncbi:sugar ABC transporter permease YjfF, partial [Planctomycetota bacterium]